MSKHLTRDPSEARTHSDERPDYYEPGITTTRQRRLASADVCLPSLEIRKIIKLYQMGSARKEWNDRKTAINRYNRLVLIRLNEMIPKLQMANILNKSWNCRYKLKHVSNSFNQRQAITYHDVQSCISRHVSFLHDVQVPLIIPPLPTARFLRQTLFLSPRWYYFYRIDNVNIWRSVFIFASCILNQVQTKSIVSPEKHLKDSGQPHHPHRLIQVFLCHAGPAAEKRFPNTVSWMREQIMRMLSLIWIFGHVERCLDFERGLLMFLAWIHTMNTK